MFLNLGPVLSHQMIPQQQQQIRMTGMTIGPQGAQIGHGPIGNVPLGSQGVMGQGIGPQNTIVQQAPMTQVINNVFCAWQNYFMN